MSALRDNVQSTKSRIVKVGRSKFKEEAISQMLQRNQQSSDSSNCIECYRGIGFGKRYFRVTGIHEVPVLYGWAFG